MPQSPHKSTPTDSGARGPEAGATLAQEPRASTKLSHPPGPWYLRPESCIRGGDSRSTEGSPAASVSAAWPTNPIAHPTLGFLPTSQVITPDILGPFSYVLLCLYIFVHLCISVCEKPHLFSFPPDMRDLCPCFIPSVFLFFFFLIPFWDLLYHLEMNPACDGPAGSCPSFVRLFLPSFLLTDRSVTYSN